MKKRENTADTAIRRAKKESEQSPSFALFVLLLVLFAISHVCTILASSSTDYLYIGSLHLSISAFAGVFSSFSNLCIIFIVVFFGKRGFIISLLLLFCQAPMLIMGIIRQQNLSRIPGLFTNLLTITAIILLYIRNKKIEDFQSIEIDHLKEQQMLSQRLFEQTATALVNAIDAKDTYSRGHSMRVAEYSEKIAREMGKSDEECHKIYYAALLHDVGKIGVSDDIINKKGKLTDEEYDAIKQHPVFGNQILSSITEYPYLSIGAHFHHERYDGRGYPDKLKGEDIPEIARIIAVADAYDAMTSTRSYRNAIPQQIVREEIVKNSGTQFDPEVAKIMQHIIDMDTEYKMKERSTVHELSGKSELICGEYRDEISEGIILTPFKTTIELISSPINGAEAPSYPTMIIFDSLDGRVHKNEQDMKELNYFEFAEIRLDGDYELSGARKIETKVIDKADSMHISAGPGGTAFVVDAVRSADHILIHINDGKTTTEITLALPDCARYSYIGLTGENCHISDVHIRKSNEMIPDDQITRIAEMISYIDVPQGDIPNVQIDGFRRTASEGVKITNGMTIRFHAMSLPTARLIWHCPYIDLYTSDDGKVNGPGFRDYALIRLDGENWDGEGKAKNKLLITKTDAFKNWDEWKKLNKEGYECEVTFEKKGNTIITRTENHGICLENTTTILEDSSDVYVSITGDQCALTNIRIIRK